MAEAQAADMDRAVAAARQAFDDGSLAPDDPRPAGGVPAGPGGRPGGPGRRHRPDLAARVRRAPPDRPRGGERCGGHLRVLRRTGRHLRLGGTRHSPASPGFGLLVQGAGRRGRRHHPVERAAGADQLQDRPRTHRRLHGDPEVVTGSARRGLSGRRGRRGDRAATGGDQRGHRRPRGVGAAGPGPAGRQDHLHRLDRRRPADRLAVRRADRPLHPRARGEVGRRGPRRRRSRDRPPSGWPRPSAC